MACSQYWHQLRELQDAMRTMRLAKVQLEHPAYQQLLRARGSLLSSPGFKVPRTIIELIKFVAASPGELTLWHDAESGWMLEVRELPGSPPVYTAVPDEVAMDIVQGRRIHEHHETYSRAPVNIDQ